MSTVRPFKAVRPAEGLESSIAALPYDVFKRYEARDYVKDKPLSFLNIDRAETHFDDDVDTYDERVYLKAREIYDGMLEKGEFIRDEKPFFYLYEQTMDGRTQTGLVCTASVSEYDNNIILKHENTLREKEQDRINHIKALNAQTGPIFLAYRDKGLLKDLFAKIKSSDPYASFKDHDVLQRLWVISDPADISFIQDMFLSVSNLYIADGHHRCASACRVCHELPDDAGDEKNYFLSVIFPDSELMIMDYNRLVKDLNGYTAETFLDAISDRFDVTERENNDEKPARKGDIYMFLEGKSYVLNLKSEYLKNDPIGILDVSVLQDNLLDPVLNIKNPKEDPRIDFVGGIRGIKGLKERLD
ncbi:MAG: DUF1015 domain-containing protein, partial [Lachnospiraceae bacterium]|nr:DUF1015 domain-containing protein [Lachnospiraceae bacterium]